MPLSDRQVKSSTFFVTDRPGSVPPPNRQARYGTCYGQVSHGYFVLFQKLFLGHFSPGCFLGLFFSCQRYTLIEEYKVPPEREIDGQFELSQHSLDRNVDSEGGRHRQHVAAGAVACCSFWI